MSNTAADDFSSAALLFAILDSSGAVVVEYKYDAWGNHEAVVADGNYVTLANLNPYRYRGYYYDSETGLYFLQTRYYDPETGRFISRDSIEYADPETICGLNLYAYCGNNPVMYSDPSGTFFLISLLIAIGVGMLAGGVIGGVSAVVKGDNFWSGALSGALIRGVLGATTIFGGATMLAITGKAVTGFVVAATFAGKAALLAATVAGTATLSFAAGVGAYAIREDMNGRTIYLSEAIGQGINTAFKGLFAFGTGMMLATTGIYNNLVKGVVWSLNEKMKYAVVRAIVSAFFQQPFRNSLK